MRLCCHAQQQRMQLPPKAHSRSKRLTFQVPRRHRDRRGSSAGTYILSIMRPSFSIGLSRVEVLHAAWGVCFGLGGCGGCSAAAAASTRAAQMPCNTPGLSALNDVPNDVLNAMWVIGVGSRVRAVTNHHSMDAGQCSPLAAGSNGKVCMQCSPVRFSRQKQAT